MHNKLTLLLANLMAIYIIASIYYIIVTRNIGTPFKDSLSLEQIEIQKKSAQKRKSVFFHGAILGFVIMIIHYYFS